MKYLSVLALVLVQGMAYGQCQNGSCSTAPRVVYYSTMPYADAKTGCGCTPLGCGCTLPCSCASGTGKEALAEVNATRAKRGLRPFTYDANLTAGAINVAEVRAKALCAGHSANDFAGLPVGTHAKAAGCAAWSPGQGWGACCTYENWTYAGAGFAIGRDGKRYMQLFVR